MRRAKKFVINAAILTANALLVRIVSVSFGVYIANRIGAEGVGVFQLITSVYLFAITLATSGIHLTTTRLVTEELAQNRPATAQKALHIRRPARGNERYGDKIFRQQRPARDPAKKLAKQNVHPRKRRTGKRQH